jgi:tRNA(Ile)-lysidine synthase TilS/MesJ
LADGDHVLVGLSGGKDSLALVELLGRQARIYVPRIRVTAVHVRVEGRNYRSDLSYLQSFCREAGVPLLVRDTAIRGEERKDPCFLCSWYRRKALFEVARELGCNKIAFGHHRDDVLETLLLNLVYEGRFSTIEPSLPLDKMPIALIRPLWCTDEDDLCRYALLAGYRRQEVLCPFERHSRRHDMTALLRQLQMLNPEVRSSLLHALTRDTVRLADGQSE